MQQARYRLGCDIGGTFTDLVLLDDVTGELHLEKCLTVPADPSQGFMHGVRLLVSKCWGRVCHSPSPFPHALCEKYAAFRRHNLSKSET